jgi:ABC-type siderophore export system fused ATPase/permease subunit
MSPGLKGVRFLRIVLTAIVALVAVVGGLFAAAAIAVLSIVFLYVRRLLGRKIASLPPTIRTQASSSKVSDAIDVTVTEIPTNR